jgi:hypothetical protein
MKTTESIIVVENGFLYINDIEIMNLNNSIGDDPFDDPNNDGIAMI